MDVPIDLQPPPCGGKGSAHLLVRTAIRSPKPLSAATGALFVEGPPCRSPIEEETMNGQSRTAATRARRAGRHGFAGRRGARSVAPVAERDRRAGATAPTQDRPPPASAIERSAVEGHRLLARSDRSRAVRMIVSAMK